MADIFVSYSSEDRARVEPIVAQLESAGFSVWWDRQLQGGTVFSRKIETEIEIAQLVIVVWSQASLNSQWVADEAEIGRQQNKLLPVTFEAVEPPIGFRQLQTISVEESNGALSAEFASKLGEAVAHHLTPQAPATTNSGSAPDASVAVLPFVNMSSDPEQEYFSDGISEELLNLLAKIKQMHVTSRTSSFQFKGKNLDITKIGEVLGVIHVLEGSVRKAGNRVRITAQLIEVATGYHKWSETYDRTLDDIFAIQDEISAAIVEALKEHILGQVEAPVATRSNSTEAYEYYLLGKQAISKRTEHSIKQAISHFETSLARDPDFLPAMTGLADGHLLLSDDAICYGKVPLLTALARALPILDMALERSPVSEEVHASRSFYFHLLGDSEQAQVHAEKAIEINPNCSRAYRTLGLILKRSGDPRALVIKAREKVLHLDPASPTDLINLFGELPPRSRIEEAQQLLDRIEALEPGSVFAEWARFDIAWNSGRIKQGLAIYTASTHLLRDRQWSSGMQWCLTLFGYGDMVEALDPATALHLYCQCGLHEDANRLAAALKGGTVEGAPHVPGMTMALWHVLSERYDEADRLLQAHDENGIDKWGAHFDSDEFYLGARLSWFVRRKLGDDEGANFFEQKLKELYSVRTFDFEGDHKATSYLGACIANMNGDRQRAVEEIKYHTQRFPGSSITIFHDPLLKDLNGHAEFERLKSGASEYIASEKQAATLAGLLPPSPELFRQS